MVETGTGAGGGPVIPRLLPGQSAAGGLGLLAAAYGITGSAAVDCAQPVANTHSGQTAAGGLGLPDAASGNAGSATVDRTRPVTDTKTTTVGRLGSHGEWAGTLSLDIGQRSGRSIAVRQHHAGALRILRPHYLDESGQVCYVVINPGGAYLGGDRYLIEVDIADGADLLLTTQSATKIYRTPGSRAEQHMHLRLGPGARLEHVPDQLIAYREASYSQVTTVDMDPSATLVMAEVLTPGWSPDGRLFRYDEIRMRNEISIAGRLTVLDNLLIRPGTGSPVDSMCNMAHYTHLGSLLVMDARVDAALVADMHALLAPIDPDGQLGITLLDGPGFAVRALSRSTEPLNALVGAAVDQLRERWAGQEQLNLRKY